MTGRSWGGAEMTGRSWGGAEMTGRSWGGAEMTGIQRDVEPTAVAARGLNFTDHFERVLFQ